MKGCTKLSYSELKKVFCRSNLKGNKESFEGYIVFREDNWTQPFSVESRTYKVWSDEKAYRYDAIGYSVIGSSLDGSDNGVRLDTYMRDEKGGKDGWVVECCYCPTKFYEKYKK